MRTVCPRLGSLHLLFKGSLSLPQTNSPCLFGCWTCFTAPLPKSTTKALEPQAKGRGREEAVLDWQVRQGTTPKEFFGKEHKGTAVSLTCANSCERYSVHTW